MAGLLDGFLPWAFSTGNTIKRNVRGLLTDPVSFGGSLMQDLQTQNQQRSQDFNTLFQPGVFTSPQEQNQAMTRAAQEAVNYAAPTVWHGSPHKFDKFDSSKIGTGEGAQAYGHGLYFADERGVANTYAQTLSDDSARMIRPDGVGISADEARRQLQRTIYENSPGVGRAHADDIAKTLIDGRLQGDDIGHFEKFVKNSDWTPTEKQAHLAGIAQAKSFSVQRPDPQLYKVDLPDSAVAKMLDWDKPLSEQAALLNRAPDEFSATLQEKAKQLVDESSEQGILKRALAAGMTREEAAKYAKANAYEPTGNHLYAALGRDADAAGLLRKMGIPGIRYLDGGSRGAGTGTRNYVVFPGEEGMLRILERNGQGLIKQESEGLLGKVKPTQTFWHGSQSPIDALDFSKSVDGAVHFGSKAQAEMRGRKAGSLIEAELNISKPMRSRDTGGNWKDKVKNAKAKGYDGIVYLNRYEGITLDDINRAQAAGVDLDRLTDAQFRKFVPGAQDSFIVFSPDQVKTVQNIKGRK